jgi:hypothetical protein
MALITALTYVVAAWAKIDNGGIEWVTGDVLRNHVAHDNLRKHLLGDVSSPFGGWLTRYGWLFLLMALASMVIELSAPLVLLWRRAALWWIAATWSFHVAVLVLMAVLFPYQLLGVAFLPAMALYSKGSGMIDPINRRWRRGGKDLGHTLHRVSPRSGLDLRRDR